MCDLLLKYFIKRWNTVTFIIQYVSFCPYFGASVVWSIAGMWTKVPWLRREFRFAGFAQISVWWKDKVGNILQDCLLHSPNEDVNMLTLAMDVLKTTTSGINRLSFILLLVVVAAVVV